MVNTDCDPVYTDCGNEAYGDEKQVTSDVLKSYCQSLQYLYNKAGELQDLIPPTLRKRFNPALTDEWKSWGMTLDTGDNCYKFSNSLGDLFTEHFDSADVLRIDYDHTTAKVDLDNHLITLHPVTVPGVYELATEHLGPWGGMHCNTHWYIGYDRHAPYVKTAAQIKDPLNPNVLKKSVARAQVFTVEDGKSGYLHNITLNIQGSVHAEDDLYVELRTTNNLGRPTSTIIARERIQTRNFKESGTKIAIPFKNQPWLQENTSYAVVVRSPFTSWKNHYGIGGWGANCYAKKCSTDPSIQCLPYQYGNAFTSNDNGKTWICHDKANAGRDLPYKEGKYAPIDFGFYVSIKTPDSYNYPTGTQEVVYLKAMRTNPITQVTLLHSDNNATGVEGTVVYEVSVDHVHWHALNSGNNYIYEFNKTTHPDLADSEIGSTHLWTRATLTKVQTDQNAPQVSYIGIETINTPAKHAYIRTLDYNPRLDQPLGMTIWSGLNAPYLATPNTDCNVDIVRNVIKTDWIYSDGTSQNFLLEDYPAFPMVDIVFYKDSGVSPAVIPMFEWEDYKIGTDETILYDTKDITFNTMPEAGWFKIRYYPTWIRNLKDADFPLRLDMFEETFTGNGITPLVLKALPTDPLRKVLSLGDPGTVNDDVEMVEDIDFTVDYMTGVITPTSSWTGKTLQIKYTPNLPDTGLSIVYRCTRENTELNTQLSVQPNWMEYKV